MAKEVEVKIKLQVKGGQANPAPPVGPALGAKGVNIMEFCKRFNAETQDKMGKVCPVLITVYKDKSFDFVIKTAPASIQLMELSGAKKGSAEPNRNKVGKVTWDQVRQVAEDWGHLGAVQIIEGWFAERGINPVGCVGCQN